MDLTNIQILLIGFVLYIIAIVLTLITKNRFIMLATIVLWFIPIFIVDDIFIIIFSIIMIIFTIFLTTIKEDQYQWMFG